jgi:ATP-binding cassette, subfamily F, member 2
MPVSASKAARQAKRAAAGDGKDTKKTAASKLAAKSAASSKNVSNNPSENASKASSVDGDGPSMMDAEDFIDERVQKLALQEDEHGMSDRVTTGVLASQGASRDVKITSASLVFHGRVLINDTTIEINFGRRYGLLGENGCGKSTLLKAIDKREFPFPEHVDIYLLNEGAPPSNDGALDWVVKEAENEMARLDKLAEDILERDGPENPVLEELYEVGPHLVYCQI